MENSIGIVGYGCYIPRLRITIEEIARVWGADAASVKSGLLVDEKSVPEMDEDTITIGVEAGRNALLRAGIEPRMIGAVYVGSESHPYAVKPSGTVVAEALMLPESLMVADLEFACKAGTAAMQCCYGLVKAGEIDYGMAIGADTAQGRPGDALEYTAAAGGGAFIIGKDPLAMLEGTCSYTTDTSDFWRKQGEDYPSHGARFTGKPAYFNHVVACTNNLLEKLSLRAGDFDHVVFHMPNTKFPLAAAKLLGFPTEKLEQSLVVRKIGNTYSGSSLLGLCSVLDIAKPGERILLTSYGSGAGADSFSFVVTDRIFERRGRAPDTGFYINRKKYIDYGTYLKLRGKIKV